MATFMSRPVEPMDFIPELLDNFADNEWSAIIWACQTGNVPDTWTVGSQKPMTINSTDYAIDIIGLNHDDYADGSGKAPITFMLHDVYAEYVKMNTTGTNVGGWKSCNMRATILPDILTTMPANVQRGIKEVVKYASAGNMSESVIASTDKLFLLSEIEVFGTTEYSAAGEGDRYAYFVETSGETKSSIYFLRSPDIESSTKFCLVTSKGLISRVAANRKSTYTAFAFCF